MEELQGVVYQETIIELHRFEANVCKIQGQLGQLCFPNRDLQLWTSDLNVKLDAAKVSGNYVMVVSWWWNACDCNAKVLSQVAFYK